jgi:hypothetical protein
MLFDCRASSASALDSGDPLSGNRLDSLFNALNSFRSPLARFVGGPAAIWMRWALKSSANSLTAEARCGSQTS